ncbi:hypothetical protein AVEN_2697-1 [Araneus ventricosus]|uniref:Uncharacterized protein n=1 Tax=Araneus ventricosus TaxID=182803 RepID=A0A4Y2JVE9_ARAVE|nr:hypothetical protein AVEN_2697-1 [Araneus ventricosus]
MQDGASLYTFNSVMGLLTMHFVDDRIISRHFPTNWLPITPDLNPCDFWLWGLSERPSVHWPDFKLKPLIAQHIHNISTDTLQSVVEHVISRFELVAENNGLHIEHFLSKSCDI